MEISTVSMDNVIALYMKLASPQNGNYMDSINRYIPYPSGLDLGV